MATSSSGSVDYVVSYADITTTTFTPGSADGNVTTATTTTIVAAPGASTQRQIKFVSVFNRGSAANGVELKYNVSGTERRIINVTLAAGEKLEYVDGCGFRIFFSNGQQKSSSSETVTYNGYTVPLLKVGTVPEAVASWYCFSKDSGFPGAWDVGTPGLAGRATDGTTASDAGCLPILNASTGSNYLTFASVTNTAACHFNLMDVVWVNSGAVVTTTTAQTVNSVAFPARDIQGSTDGLGYEIGVLVTASTTNAGAVTNMTCSYTNSDGTAGKTATIASFPATAVVGTFVPFRLAAGDKGVRSIQSWTLGTSLVTGSVSLVAYKRILGRSVVLANAGSGDSDLIPSPGIKLYNGSCLLPFIIVTSTGAQTINGSFAVAEK